MMMVENNKAYTDDSSVKRLYRSRQNRIVGGVCGGLAEYFEIDPLLIRIVWALITFFGGVGFIAYIIGLIIIPNNPEQDTPADRTGASGQDKAMLWGSLLIIIGTLLILRQFGIFYYINLWNIPWQVVWATFLILFGVFLIYNRHTAPGEFNTDQEESAEGKPQFYRVMKNKMVSGVCSGLAAYFDIDVTLVRLAWVIVTLASVGIGILAYLIMVIVFPEMPE